MTPCPLRVEGTIPAPAQIRRELKEIDPTVELIGLEPGTWLLGAVRPTDQRRQHGDVLLAADMRYLTRSDIGALRAAQCVRAGLAPIDVYHGIPTSAIARDLRQRDFLYRHMADELFEARFRASMGETALEERMTRLRDAWTTHGADAWRHATRKPVSVTV
jgi:hypothetical protein